MTKLSSVCSWHSSHTGLARITSGASDSSKSAPRSEMPLPTKSIFWSMVPLRTPLTETAHYVLKSAIDKHRRAYARFKDHLWRRKLRREHVHSRMVPVRVKNDDLKLFLAAAKANKQTLSGWIRTTLRNGVQK